jgi:hypothetical protein
MADSPDFVFTARQEVAVMCPVAGVEVTTVNPTWNSTSIPSFFEFDCAACGEHHVIHLRRPNRHNED